MIFSIIIPTCNRIELLSKCLDSLTTDFQTLSEKCEVIVTDDSNNDVSKYMIKEKYNWVKYIEGPKKGPAVNRNNGANYANGEWLIFLDDDCLPQKNWLKSYINAIELDKKQLVFEGSTNSDRPKSRFDEEAPINLNGGNLWSCNFAIKKDLFAKLNGFDESFPFAAMEDVDFCKRVKIQSNIEFLPEALVIHPWRRVKPFSTFQKHLKSHKHFAEKYGLLSQRRFRIDRVKIFISCLFIDFKELWQFYFKGWPIYFEKCLLNFCLIFI